MPGTGQTEQIVRENSEGGARGPDRRVERTIRSLLQAFIALMFERNYRTISVADIAQRADVGRSTFYEHFRSKDEILLKSMAWMFATLANVVGPADNSEALANLVAHFWDNRRLARVVLSPPIEAKLRRALAAEIEARLAGRADAGPVAARIAATRIAAGQLGLLEAWTKGELTASPEQINEAIIVAARL
jgi:AcrR family transcriptional regulator